MQRAAFVPVVMLALALVVPANSYAGAWTLKKFHWQNFSSTTVSEARASFGSNGQGSTPTKFKKLLLQNTLEFGLTDRVTLFATPAFVIASIQEPAAKTSSAQNASFEAGARILLLGKYGALSLQGSYKSAGAFDLSVSADRQPGQQIDLRLLYGTSFTLLDRAAFVDVQVGQRWINHPRPNETPIDLTAGLWITPRTMLLAQSLNIISAGDAIAPYSYYRSHKVELSVVEKFAKGWSVKLGAFAAPTGQNALVERGISVALWTRS